VAQIDEFRWQMQRASHDRSRPRPALFLDRDGVLITERRHLGDPAEVTLCPGAKETVRAARQQGVLIVVITNQSGIGRGTFAWRDFEAVHRRMLDLLADDDPFDAVYANGYVPDDPRAAWRKPNPGMILQAITDLNIVSDTSILVGDKASDLAAGRAAGIGRLVHVLTGHGRAEREDVMRRFPDAECVESLRDLQISNP
jgi:D-glycero-D-manno-heptose 1,7-bisphosphate phosphatase